MKRILAVILSVLILATFSPAVISGIAEGVAPFAPILIKKIWNGTVADSFDFGDGSAENPYIISSGSQLAYLAKSINTSGNYYGSNFKLGCDIYLNDTSNWQNWDTAKPANVWEVIGSKQTDLSHGGNVFQGSFDGNGYTIYGIYINTTDNNQGLFGTTMYATLKNIVIAESYIKGNEYIGSVVGGAMGGLITECRNEAKIVGSENIGGIVGAMVKAAIQGCNNSGEIIGSSAVGGVVGALTYTSSVKNCYNTGSVSGNESVGGVVGFSFIQSPVVITCYNAGSVNGATNVGGVLGSIDSTTTAKICYNVGTVVGGTNVGGVVGLRDNSTISDCYYLQGQAKDYSGAVKYGIGGEVTGYTIENSVRTATGLTEEEMKKESSYVGFDFESAWMFTAIGDYKYPVIITNAPYMSISIDNLSSGIFTELGAETKVRNFANSRIKVYSAMEAPLANDAIIGTGCTFDFTNIHGITIKYTVCIRGDVNGDGKYDSKDYIMLKRAVLGSYVIEGVFAKAGCVSGGSSFAAKDYIMLKRAVLGTYELK